MSKIFEHSNGENFTIFCPACKSGHTINKQWQYDGNKNRPTISPSILLWNEKGYRCHSFVKNGNIEFLGDCSHGMANSTVELPEIESLTNYSFGS